MSRKPFIVLGVVVVATVIVHALLLGGAPYHRLAKTTALYGTISQSIGTNDKKSLAIGDKDFTLEDTQHFGDDWLVTSIVPTPKSSLARAVVVMQKRNGTFQVVLGPGTAFDSSTLVSLPADLGNYLTQQGYIYEFSYQ